MKAGKFSGCRAKSLQNRVALWSALLDRCARKPTRRQVHALRVMTLRLQAELERDAAELPTASHQAQAILRFGKQSARLRRALGSVRELDVWISKLRGLRSSLAETPQYVPRSMRDCTRQIERLELRLTENRRTSEKKLVAEIQKRHAQLKSAAEEAGAAVEGATRGADAGAFRDVFARFAVIAAEFSSLNEENLHDFRKRIKTVRYLAEMWRHDRECVRLATQLQNLQSAIGEWHDWQMLAQRLSHGKHARKEYLADLLENIAHESLHSAIEACHGLTARLLALAPVANGAPPRKPVRKVDGVGVIAHTRVA